jgi:hypothetical protein
MAGEVRSRLQILKLLHHSSQVSNYVTMSCDVAIMIPCSKLSPKILILNGFILTYLTTNSVKQFNTKQKKTRTR